MNFLIKKMLGKLLTCSILRDIFNLSHAVYCNTTQYEFITGGKQYAKDNLFF